MNLWASATHYFALLASSFVLTLLVFISAGLVLHWILKRTRLTALSPQAPSWSRVLVIAITIGVSLVTGIVVGLNIGIAKVGLRLVDDVGLQLVQSKTREVAESLGFSNLDQGIEVQKLHSILVQIKNIQVAELSNHRSAKAFALNWIFDRIREPFVLKAEEHLRNYASNDKVSLATVTSSAWRNATANIKMAIEAFILIKWAIGFIVLGGYFVALIIVAAVNRAQYSSSRP